MTTDRQATEPDTGYVRAFYELADMMGMSAQPRSPKDVWESEMKPRLAALLATEPDAGKLDEAYRTTDESGSPESAGTVAWNWISELAQAEHRRDPSALVTDTIEAKAYRLYRGTKLLAVATTFRDDMNFTVLVRWTAPALAQRVR